MNLVYSYSCVLYLSIAIAKQLTIYTRNGTMMLATRPRIFITPALVARKLVGIISLVYSTTVLNDNEIENLAKKARTNRTFVRLVPEAEKQKEIVVNIMARV